jgi:XTP/dITP diphosphohydrolase
MSRRVLLGSNNGAKLRELCAILTPYGFDVVSPADVGLSLEIEESGRTFAENAVLKANAFHRASGLVTLADDSGLIVDALHGEPGVYSARYGGPGLDDAVRTALVLERLRGVPDAERTARFVTAIAVVGAWPEPRIFEGSVEGRIVTEPRGGGGFGYDPIFFYEPFDATFAELTAQQKDAVSHRGEALGRAGSALGSYTWGNAEA